MKKGLLFIVILVSLSSCRENQKIELIDFSGSMTSYFETIGIEYEIDNNNVLYFQKTSENYNSLIRLLYHLDLRKEVILNNIMNVNTTRTIDGGSYTRKVAILKSSGKTEVIDDTASEKRLVWDPTHPDAIKTGPEKGYVEYSNVSNTVEIIDLEFAFHNSETVLSAIRCFNPDIIAEFKDIELILQHL